MGQDRLVKAFQQEIAKRLRWLFMRHFLGGRFLKHNSYDESQLMGVESKAIHVDWGAPHSLFNLVRRYLEGGQSMGESEFGQFRYRMDAEFSCNVGPVKFYSLD